MNLEDWKKANPGKSINEYYAYARKNGIQVESGSKISSSPTANSQPRNSVKNNNSWFKHIIPVVLLLIMIATNPTETQHYDNAVNEVSTQLKAEAGNWGILEGVKNFGSNFLTKATVSVDNKRNFLLFSFYDVNIAGDKIGTSIGFIGFNYIIWKEQNPN